ncbi:ATP-binding cassette domain-containing protein [Sulfurimonas aquatica]|uniref:ATP-binding cassette domain-containing protein n=1 Tax=Sulfurimonas aquatica TaxID=2672570 RepID=A0A975B0R7_9BACT|nr:ATP-binding cassette domain-containing protein [Sulfurimonas aquatica]QSZ42025.1 ATP-binding cassette domain-containing protein [Sulfurimonas aquatica]
MINIDITKQLHGSDGFMDLDIKLNINEGDFIALGGESGSGKTTLLRVLAGLEDAKGSITVGDKTWLNAKESLSVQERDIGFVFQDYALFPNMSVKQNLLFVSKDKELAEHLLEVTQLSSLKDRMPNRLSGGQKQRVSLCRALMAKPKLLLMDEPLSALDPAMRSKLQQEILSLHKEFGTTTIMVSHDPSEMYRLSERVIVLDKGKIINDGNAKDVLLKTQGSAKFSFEGELLDIIKVDVIFIAIISIGKQIVEVVITKEEAQNFTIGQIINVSTKAFSPNVT